MKIDKIQNNNRISFAAIHEQKGMDFNLKRKKIADSIKREFNKVNPNDKDGRTYLAQAESQGFNVYLSYSKDKKDIDSVRVDIADTLDEQRAKAHKQPLLNESTKIGVYKSPYDFNIEDFEKYYNPIEKVIKKASSFINSFIYASAAAIALGLGLVAVKQCNNKQEGVNIKKQAVEIVNDTIKKDSIKPIINMIKK